MPTERDLVLAQPDLAARLTRRPLDYARPEQWNGYIPPYTVSGEKHHIRNDSARRVHLVAIVREAMARTYGPDVARAWVDETNTDRWGTGWTPHHIVEGD